MLAQHWPTGCIVDADHDIMVLMSTKRWVPIDDMSRLLHLTVDFVQNFLLIINACLQIYRSSIQDVLQTELSSCCRSCSLWITAIIWLKHLVVEKEQEVIKCLGSLVQDSLQPFPFPIWSGCFQIDFDDGRIYSHKGSSDIGQRSLHH